MISIMDVILIMIWMLLIGIFLFLAFLCHCHHNYKEIAKGEYSDKVLAITECSIQECSECGKIRIFRNKKRCKTMIRKIIYEDCILAKSIDLSCQLVLATKANKCEVLRLEVVKSDCEYVDPEYKWVSLIAGEKKFYTSADIGRVLKLAEDDGFIILVSEL